MKQPTLRWAYENLTQEDETYRSFLLGQMELCQEVVLEASHTAMCSWDGRPIIFVKEDWLRSYPLSNLLWFGYLPRDMGKQKCLNYVISTQLDLEFDTLHNRIVLPKSSRIDAAQIANKLSALVQRSNNRTVKFLIYDLG